MSKAWDLWAECPFGCPTASPPYPLPHLTHPLSIGLVVQARPVWSCQVSSRIAFVPCDWLFYPSRPEFMCSLAVINLSVTHPSPVLWSVRPDVVACMFSIMLQWDPRMWCSLSSHSLLLRISWTSAWSYLLKLNTGNAAASQGPISQQQSIQMFSKRQSWATVVHC